MRAATAAAAILVLCAGAAAASAQSRASPYADSTAEALHRAAVAKRVQFDNEVIEYTAVVRQRIAAALRTPLKDRTLYRVESAHRVFWRREGDMLVQALALREQTPVGLVEGDGHFGLVVPAFDPLNDRLLFGFAGSDDDMGDRNGDDFWFEHPLYDEYRESYRFSTGDTLLLTLPDGRSLRAVELQVVPVAADVHRMTGSLWIEPETGALVRAVYRLSDTFDALRDIAGLRDEVGDDLKYVPGFLKPWTFELSLIAVDYALWDFDVWLPRSMRAEGVAGAGIFKAPATVDVAYEMESVLTETGLAEGDDADGVEEIHFRTRSEAMAYLSSLSFDGEVEYVSEPGRSESDGRRVRYLVPEDPSFLATSPELPPPVWEDAPGFASQYELQQLLDGLGDLPTPPVIGMPRSVRWGPQRSDLIRYNRVEALSVGARGQIRPQTFLGPLSVIGTARIGAGDLVPNARVDVTRERLNRRTTFSVFHELTSVDERARHLGLGNSLLAATVGRDDGDYFRRSGTWLEWTPPTADRRVYRVRGYAEYQTATASETDFALFRIGSDRFAFRDNLVADEGWEYGALIEVSPWWGTDPDLVQGGVEVSLQAATGDWEYARSTLTTRLAVPLSSDLRLGVEAGGGTSWGAPPTQKLFLLGGPVTLRGYEPRALEGTSYLRARGEVARRFSFGAVSLFSDVGWAGDRTRIRIDESLYSAGVGLSILDGLIRFDAAWGLRVPRDFRFDVYLDAIL